MTSDNENKVVQRWAKVSETEMRRMQVGWSK